ncbi:acylneuraminate cytidylyltransferase family protein [Christiangramia sp. OXR-203]|jgi:N-acylneuraminate cytidylyltransferase|uniref:acylneuraminate cytidylyltransferase family protein n=1 Tax=Christiangramia sp. OXR-203 TaxID=3100176 RepID=UPI002AC945E3|nr:acylneuraminate cytidylyltransferase family protein [Christiangramia sp. OXR-203]WPY99713.1 acylneuraminate cytidylyltransferase family protein [Christiangramia sp. OXR-203]
MDNLVDQKIIAVIPARGGSKRIPKKNIIEICGKPMLAWTIEAALQSKYIDEVLLSTDDEEIAEVGRKFGAKVPFLRDTNADDHSPISLATIRAVSQWEEGGHGEPEIVIQLMANCPIRDSEDIDAAIENFVDKGIQYQISCFKYGWMNPWWAHKLESKGKATPVFKNEERIKRSQDQPDLYCPTGAIWIANRESLLHANSFYGPEYSFYPMHWIKAIDIDEYEDLEMAEYFLKLHEK